MIIFLDSDGVYSINATLPADISMTVLRTYMADLAQRHGIAYVKTGSSALAEVIL